MKQVNALKDLPSSQKMQYCTCEISTSKMLLHATQPCIIKVGTQVDYWVHFQSNRNWTLTLKPDSTLQ